MSLALLFSTPDTTGCSAVTSCGGRAFPPRLGPSPACGGLPPRREGMGVGPRSPVSPETWIVDSAVAQARPPCPQKWVNRPWLGLLLGGFAE